MEIDITHIRDYALLERVAKIFAKNGFSAWLVGGAVRDALLGRAGGDFDIATDARPEDVIKMFRTVIPTGIKHGTVTIRTARGAIETTTFRTEGGYADGRHPDKVSYNATIEEDLGRRDFTMNAIAYDILGGATLDPFDGARDIRSGVIRAVGDPASRFLEDGLRPVRAMRFVAQLGFAIEPRTYEAIKRQDVQDKVRGVSHERVRDEFEKLLSGAYVERGLRCMEETGIMDIFIPEFKACRGCMQHDARGYHDFDVADHIMYTCEGEASGKPEVRLAAFFHDIGKPQTRTCERVNGATRIHFTGHARASERIARDVMRRLRASNDDIEKVGLLVREHMFDYRSDWSDGAVRRFIRRTGVENIDDLIALRLADIYGQHRRPPEGPVRQSLQELKARVKGLLDADDALSLKNLKVNGNDLMGIGIPQGRVIGDILGELLERVTDSPELNRRDELLRLAKDIYEKRG